MRTIYPPTRGSHVGINSPVVAWSIVIRGKKSSPCAGFGCGTVVMIQSMTENYDLFDRGVYTGGVPCVDTCELVF